MSTQQLATTAAPKELRSLITSDAVQAQLAIALPRYYAPDQFTLIVRTALNRNPKLGECTQGSFLAAMLTAAQMGILPNGRDGHLIPRWNGKQNCMECTFQPDYKGLVGLIRRNDTVADIYAVCVHKADLFKITQGLHRDIIHEPDYTRDRGEIIGVYAVILFKTGLSTWEFLPRPEVESIRERSDSWKAHKSKGYDTPWKTDEGEMFKKTAIKRVSKLADLSPDTMDRILNDPDITFEKTAEVKEIKSAVIPETKAPALTDAAQPADGLASDAADPQEEPGFTSTPAVEPAGAPAEKPAQAKEVSAAPAEKKGGKLLKKAAEPAASTAPAGNPKVTEILARLEKGGWTEAQFTGVVVAFDIFKEGDALAGADENTLDAFLENWDEVAEELKKL